MTLGEMCKDELICACLRGNRGCLRRGEVTVFLREASFSFQIGRLADQEVDILGQLKGRVTESGVHDEGHGFTSIHSAKIISLVSRAFNADVAVLYESTNVGPGDSGLMEPVRINTKLFRFLDAVANGGYPVVQMLGGDAEFTNAAVGSVGIDRLRYDSDWIMPDGAGLEPLQVWGAVGGVPDRDWLASAVEGSTLQEPWQAQRMVAVKMRDQAGGSPGDCQVGEQTLTLESFTRIEHQELLVPTKGIAIVVAVSSWSLRSGPKHN